MTTPILGPGRTPLLILLAALVFFHVLPEALAGREVFGIRLDFGLLFLIFIVLASIAKLKYVDEQVKSQSLRDERATELAARVKSGTPDEPFALYLRPFDTDKRLEIRNPRTSFNPLNPAFHLETATTDLDRALTQAVEQSLPVIAIGGVNKAIGSGQVSSPEWKIDFERLASSASLVVVVPLTRPGLRFEVDWLAKTRRLGEAVFVMPSEGTLAEGTKVSELWKASREAFSHMGLELPAFEKKGLLFYVDEDLCVDQRVQLEGISESGLRSFLLSRMKSS